MTCRLVPAIDNNSPIARHRDREGPPQFRAVPFGQELARAIEDLHAHVGTVRYIDVTAGVGIDGVRKIEFPRAGPTPPPLNLILPRRVELHDARVAVAISNIERTVRKDCYVCWLIEMLSIHSRNSRLSDDQKQLPVGTEFENLMKPNIGQPNIILPIDGEAVRHHEPICTPRPQVLSARSLENFNGRTCN